jgi:hypothetical protein
MKFVFVIVLTIWGLYTVKTFDYSIIMPSINSIILFSVLTVLLYATIKKGLHFGMLNLFSSLDELLTKKNQVKILRTKTIKSNTFEVLPNTELTLIKPCGSLNVKRTSIDKRFKYYINKYS